MDEQKYQDFLLKLSRPFIVESYYSIWKPQATKSVSIFGVAKEDVNRLQVEVQQLVLEVWGNEPAPFIINIATEQPCYDELPDELFE